MDDLDLAATDEELDGFDEASADDPYTTGDEPVVPEGVQASLAQLIQEAIDYVDDEASPERAEAELYWNGDAPREAEEGRSNIVSTDVRDAHDRMMPSLLRIFFGPEQPVVFQPRNAEDVPTAEQQSEVVQFVVNHQNPGFKIVSDVLHDATLKGLGCAHVYYERYEKAEYADMTGLTADDLYNLQADPSIEIENLQQEDGPPTGGAGEGEGADAPPVPGSIPGSSPTFSATVVRRKSNGCVKIEAFPPEEFLYTGDAERLDTAPIVGRRRSVPLHVLESEGWDREMLMEFASPYSDTALDTNVEAEVRNADLWTRNRTYDRPESYLVPVVDAYTVMDCEDGRGACLRHFLCFGDNFTIVEQEPCSMIPIAIGSGYVEPHKLVGHGLYRRLKDVQQARTAIERGTLDSLAKALDNDTVVLLNGVVMEDLADTSYGRVIRERQPNAIRELVHQFVGAQSLPMLTYYEQLRDTRAGTPPQSAGLEADALQSSTKVGVEAAVTGGQLQMERVARNLAETFFKDLYTIVRNTLRQHQDVAMIVRLRNQFVAVDPRVWDSDFDCVVNTAFGAGLDAERLQVLMEIAADQTQWIQSLGPSNPITSLGRLAHTKKQILAMRGFKDFNNYYVDLPIDWQPPPQPQQQPPDPAMILAQAQVQIETMKAEADIAKKQADVILQREKQDADIELARWKAYQEDDRARDKQAADQALAASEIEAKYKVDMQVKMAKVEAEQQMAREGVE